MTHDMRHDVCVLTREKEYDFELDFDISDI